MTTNYEIAPRSSRNFLQQVSLFYDILSGMPDLIFILDDYFSIIFCNSSAKKRFKLDDDVFLSNLKISDIIKCKNTDNGAFSALLCADCNIYKMINESDIQTRSFQECNIIDKETDCITNYKVWSTKYELNHQIYSIVTFQYDGIEAETVELEDKVFDDIIHSDEGMEILGQLLNNFSFNQMQNFRELISTVSDSLIEEIDNRKLIVKAQDGTIVPQLTMINSKHLLQTLIGVFQNQDYGKNKYIDYKISDVDINFKSDLILVRRILSCVIINALEGSKPGDRIKISITKSDLNIIFKVHNQCVIDLSVQEKIFQPTFSTKSITRGFGTFLMKIISEKVLNGKVYFESNLELGTIFTIELPIN